MTFVILKVLDASGAGYTSDVIRAIDFAVANRTRLGIDIINLSLGHPIFEPAASDPLVQAVERASRAGVIVVAAAGNYGVNPTTGLPGYAGVTSPGNAPSAITVGSVDSQDTLARSDDRIPAYSSAGPTWYDGSVKPDVVSLGHNIVAVAAKRGHLYRTHPELRDADLDYMVLSGTSMATAVTSGSIALMIEANRAENYLTRTYPGWKIAADECSEGTSAASEVASAIALKKNPGRTKRPLSQSDSHTDTRWESTTMRLLNTTRFGKAPVR